jgi:hypothetical protein
MPILWANICLIYLEITKLQLILLLNEYRDMFLDEKSNNLVNMDGCAILWLHIVAKIVVNLKGWWLIVKIIKHSCKW